MEIYHFMEYFIYNDVEVLHLTEINDKYMKKSRSYFVVNKFSFISKDGIRCKCKYKYLVKSWARNYYNKYRW